jgi:hypothetical protein
MVKTWIIRPYQGTNAAAAANFSSVINSFNLVFDWFKTLLLRYQLQLFRLHFQENFFSHQLVPFPIYCFQEDSKHLKHLCSVEGTLSWLLYSFIHALH